MVKIAQSQILRHTSLESSYIPIALRRSILEQQNYTCYFCAKEETESLCHKLPKCRGGKTELCNLLVCCIACRRQKEELTAEEYLNYTKLEVEDVFKEMIMFVKVYFLDGEIMQGETPTLVDKKDTGFYIHPDGNGETIWVNLQALKKVEFKGGRQVKSG